MREKDNEKREHPKRQAFGAGIPRRPSSHAGDGERGSIEDGLSGAWGERLADYRPKADPEFVRALRREFVAGDIRAPEAFEDSLSVTEQLLANWTPAPASDSARARALAALTGRADEVQAGPVSPRGAPQHSAGRRASAHPPEPARRMSTRLRLVAGAGLLATAAAVVIAVGSFGGDGPQPAPGAASSDTVVWTVELDSEDAAPVEALLADLRFDGEPVDSIEALAEQLETVTSIRVGASSLRVRRGDDFVLDLGPGTELKFEIEGDASISSGASRRALIASAGSVRVATGPSFDRGVPLVITTPHVRASVVGTIFGVDIEESHTCVCCLEGEVRVSRADGEKATLKEDFVSIATGHTGLAMEDEEGIRRLALIESHGSPLRALRDAY